MAQMILLQAVAPGREWIIQRPLRLDRAGLRTGPYILWASLNKIRGSPILKTLGSAIWFAPQ